MVMEADTSHWDTQIVPYKSLPPVSPCHYVHDRISTLSEMFGSKPERSQDHGEDASG